MRERSGPRRACAKRRVEVATKASTRQPATIDSSPGASEPRHAQSRFQFLADAAVDAVRAGSVITLIGVGIRLIAMQTIQQRRERENRQINERLRTLIAAYKTLGGSFTGNLAVDPTHLRDLRRRHEGTSTIGSGDARVAQEAGGFHAEIDRAVAGDAAVDPQPANARPGAERSRRVRDAVEAALSDIILLGTEQQVQLAARAATELAAGRPTHTAELVVSLRDFIRQVLDLDPVPAHLSIPQQGPARPSAQSGKGGAGAREDPSRGDGKGMGGAGMGGAGIGGGGLGSGGNLSRRRHEHTPLR